MTNKKFGFTLAEILLTLAVVGIIVALTIPSLVSRHREVVLEMKSMKAKQSAEQMIDVIVRQGGISGINNSEIMSCYTNNKTSQCFQTATNKISVIKSDSLNSDILTKLRAIQYKLAYLNDFHIIQSAMAHPSIDDDDDNYGNAINNKQTDVQIIDSISNGNVWNYVIYAFVTKDGVVFGYWNNSLDESTDGVTGFYLMVDTNGTDAPNVYGKDLYVYKITAPNNIEDVTKDYI